MVSIYAPDSDADTSLDYSRGRYVVDHDELVMSTARHPCTVDTDACARQLYPGSPEPCTLFDYSLGRYDVDHDELVMSTARHPCTVDTDAFTRQ